MKPYADALGQVGASSGSASADEIILEPYICDVLGMHPGDLDGLTYADLMPYLGYADGKALAKRTAQQERPPDG